MRSLFVVPMGTLLYPLANMELVVDGIPLQVEAAVSDTLPVSVLLGTDVPELETLLEKQVAGAVPERVKDALVVTTHAQASSRRCDPAAAGGRDRGTSDPNHHSSFRT